VLMPAQAEDLQARKMTLGSFCFGAALIGAR
jgi:hypothetical protein